MKSKLNLFVCALLAVCAMQTSAFADLALESAFYEIGTFKVICTDCSTHVRGKSMAGSDRRINTPNVDLDFKNHYLMSGSIVINQWNVETGDTRKTVIPNVLLRMHTTGLIAMMSFNGNSRMRITGMSGKSLGDIFSSPFEGGKIGVNALINLKGMLAFNSNGLGIVDTERLLAMGLGVEIVHARLVFGLNGMKSETIRVDNASVIQVNGKTIPLKDALNLKF